MKRIEGQKHSYPFMLYKGLYGTVSIDIENNRICGHVVGIEDVITYESDTVEGIKKEFEEAVDDYIIFCREKGKEPEKSFSGKLMFRPGPEVHGLLVMAAQKCGKSVNAFLTDLVREAARQEHLAC